MLEGNTQYYGMVILVETTKLYVDTAYDLVEERLVRGGYVELIDILGTDITPAQTARLSYANAEKRNVRDDEKLLKYLWVNQHTSPFEFVEVVFKIRLPIFVARQFDRHRTASQNQMSFRYSRAINLAWVPDCFRKQGKLNKQGSDKCIESDEAFDIYLNSIKSSFERYQRLLDMGISREQARSVLNFSMYTEVAWKQDLKNLFHLLNLRIDRHAQMETRKYAVAMLMLLENKLPILTGLFKDTTLSSVTLTLDELEAMIAKANGAEVPTFSSSKSRDKELKDIYMRVSESKDITSASVVEYEKIKRDLIDLNERNI